MASRTPALVRRSPAGTPSRALRRTVSSLALLAGSLGLASLATPALAQCVEGVPGEYSCSGVNQVGQVIVQDDVSAIAVAGFAVDTTGNGNGLALSLTGDGRITYVDLQASALTGAGVRLSTTGSSGLDGGSVVVFSNGAIVANGANGLRLDNAGGSDITATWTGSILNTGGNGVHVRNEFGSGDVSLTVADVQGRDDGVWFQFGGNGSLAFVAGGDLTGQTGAGLRINVGVAADDIDVQVGEVTGGTFGIVVNNDGTDSTRVVATGTVTGLSEAGISVQSGLSTTSIDVFANQVNGQTYGIQVGNFGTGATNIVATGTVAGATSFGIIGFNDVNATDLSISSADVFGNLGIIADNTGTGSTVVVSTGEVVGFTVDAIRVTNGVNAGSLLVDVNDVTGAQTGIDVVNFGSGLTTVRSSGTVIGDGLYGISLETGTGSDGVVVEVVEVHGQSTGVFITNQGTGATVLTATGQVSALLNSGIYVEGGISTTDVQIDVAGVQGGAFDTSHGIYAENEGSGGVYVTATGTVSGSAFGVLALGGATGTNVHVQAVDVLSDGNGITAGNDGSGSTRITSTGTVVGTDEVGIRAFGGANSFDVVIEANNASGGFSGVSAVSFGLGPVEITTHGVVEGGDQGIEAFSAADRVTLINEGTVRNASGLSSDRAISAQGDLVGIANSGQIRGTITSLANESLVLNIGVWDSTGGESFFMGGADSVANLDSGMIIARSNAATSDVTSLLGLEVFENRGGITLRDGGAADLLQTSANTTFVGGSTLFVDIGGQASADRFLTTGTLDIQQGSGLSLDIVEPLVLHGQYVVAEASGGLTGEFDFEDVFLTAFAGLRDGYTANTAFVEFVQLKALAEAGLTPNQKETAQGADSLPNGNAVKDALLLLPDDETAQAAFDQLSGEIHPSVRTAVVEDSRLPRAAVLDRLGYDEPERSAWGRAFGSSGRNDGDFNAAELDRETRGFLFGVDTLVGERVTVGVAGGWLETDLDVGARTSEGTVESVHLLAYAGARFGAWGLRGGVGYAATSTDTRRTIAFPGLADTASARYDGSVLQGFVEAGYRLPVGQGHVEPFVSLTALKVESDAFVEAGGPAALLVQAASEETLVSTLGLRFETGPIAGPFAVRGGAGWRHASGDLDPVGVHAFDGGAPFTILGAAQSEDAFVANAEARWTISPAISVGVAYDGVLGSDGEDHAITGSLRVVF